MPITWTLLAWLQLGIGVYSMLILVRILLSWFPQSRGMPMLQWLFACTDPYLGIFRRYIPPIGGIIDISPMLALFGLQLFNKLLIYLLR